MSRLIGNVKGVEFSMDDVLIFAKTKEELKSIEASVTTSRPTEWNENKCETEKKLVYSFSVTSSVKKVYT